MARTYSVDGRLGKVLVNGKKLKADVADVVTNATLALSSSEVSQLDLTLVDAPSFTLLNGGLFTAGTPTKAGSRLTYDELEFEVRAIEVAARGTDPSLRVTARSLGAGQLRRAKGPLIRRTITPTQFAKLEAKRAGLKFVGQPSARRAAISRQTGKDAETTWDTLQRLARELGYVCFEASGVLFFGKPTWLTQHTEKLRLEWKGAKTSDLLDALPTCRRSGDDRINVATVDALLRGPQAEALRPGMALVLDGVPTFDGRYMVTGVTMNLAEGTAISVTAGTPDNPKPEPPEKKKKKDGKK